MPSLARRFRTCSSGSSPTSTTPADVRPARYSWAGPRRTTSGVYSVVVPPGTYFAAVIDDPGFANQIYHGLPCAELPGQLPGGERDAHRRHRGCDDRQHRLRAGAGGRIDLGNRDQCVCRWSGPQWRPGPGLLQLRAPWLATSDERTGAGAGFYQFTGLAPGQYYVRTNNGGFINQLWNNGGNVPCLDCNVVTSGGTLVTGDGGRRRRA